jgi:hypothetical protein|uniref:Uncharacterized protein n=1 Tax=viral metagenome TaxID=1070528 RepID=A0A6C0LVZ2_9ZZZZ
MATYLTSTKNKLTIRAIINDKDNNTIYKVRGLHMKDLYTVKKEYTNDSLQKLEFYFNNYICENRTTKTFDNKYYYTWLQKKDIKKFVSRLLFSDIESYIYMIGYPKSLQMYEIFTNEKIDFDILKTEEGHKKLFAGILSGIFTMKDNIDMKVVEIKTLANIANNEKIYIIDGNIYNKDGSKSEWNMN